MTISASSGLGSLQMVSEQDIGWCASKDAGPKMGEFGRAIGEENECQQGR